MRTPITVASLAVTLTLFSAAVAQQRYDVQPELTGFLEEQADEGYSGGAVATDDSCDGPTCDLGNCRPCASWCFTAGALIMERSSPDDTPLVTDGYLNQTGETVLLNADEFDFDFRGGFELSAIRRNVRCTCWDLEARYFRIDGWQAIRRPVYSPTGAIVQYLRPIGETAYPGRISGSYDSHLDSLELNLRRPFCCGRYTFLAGFRFAELDERGQTITHDIGPRQDLITHDAGAINDLYGFQLGADARLFECGCFSADTLLRAGAYGNRIATSTLVTQTTGPNYVALGEKSHTSFLGELGLTGTCQINDCMALTAGYRLMWLEGVAVASDQLAVSDPIGGTTTVDTGGSPFYHGAVISLEYCR
ncbi:MAG: hypothetical protein A2V98_25730 [Planctomycetes bacterium RBG_16_64_12]|nr:MAG: hypothetical protein A2V98_25730 [Planctomycetes bacterium RBG_16_64_12]